MLDENREELKKDIWEFVKIGCVWLVGIFLVGNLLGAILNPIMGPSPSEINKSKETFKNVCENIMKIDGEGNTEEEKAKYYNCLLTVAKNQSQIYDFITKLPTNNFWENKNEEGK